MIEGLADDVRSLDAKVSELSKNRQIMNIPTSDKAITGPHKKETKTVLAQCSHCLAMSEITISTNLNVLDVIFRCPVCNNPDIITGWKKIIHQNINKRRHDGKTSKENQNHEPT